MMPSPDQPVVVGYDASNESEVALQWAAAVAQRRGAPLTIVSAAGFDGVQATARRRELAASAAQGAKDLADSVAEAVRADYPTLQIETVGAQRGAAAVLVEQSANAQLVVVGNRGRGRLRGSLLGSVAFDVATHASCPVCVVRGALRPLPSMDRPVVVGVDGSASSDAALAEAARLAHETGSYLRVVVSWIAPSGSPWFRSYEYDVSAPGGAAPRERPATEAENPWSASISALHKVYAETLKDESELAAETGEAAVAQVRRTYPDLHVEKVVREGRAEEVIVHEAADASLIAVGARGRGDFASLLLGSVSRDVIQRADCAVYVVR